MAASKITICNMALAELASTLYVTSIENPTTKEEKYCALFFPQALDFFLTLDSWACALHDKKISYNDPVVGELGELWTYEYNLPADPYCLRALYILENPKSEFIIKGRKLYCNVIYSGQITLRYTKRLTTVSDLLPTSVTALSLLLSWYLCQPLAIGRKNIKAEKWAFFLQALDIAKGVNGSLQNTAGMDDYSVNSNPPDPESESWID